MALLIPGTEQRVWTRMGAAAGPFSPLPTRGAYAFRTSLPIGYDFDGTWTFAMENHAASGEPVADMCCGLRFFFVKRATTIPAAIARIWGISKAQPLGGGDEAFMGVYLGQVRLSIGTCKGLPIDEDPIDIYKNVLLDDQYLASQVVVEHDRALQPPGLRVIGNGGPNMGTTPMVLFDALGFDRIVVTMRFTAPYENNGFGFFWTTM